MKDRNTSSPSEKVLFKRVKELEERCNSLIARAEKKYGEDATLDDTRLGYIHDLAYELHSWISWWQDINRTYTPGERQLTCRIDAQSVPG